MAPLEKRSTATGALTPNTRQIIVFLVIGLVAGFLASVVMGGEGLLRYLIVGVLGAFVGGYLFSALRIELPIKNGFLSQVVTATVGAILVVIIARLIA
jgi:uncharacterized membrane protein YeaQ/YmgE (transglycosylase-associated protein family)